MICLSLLSQQLHHRDAAGIWRSSIVSTARPGELRGSNKTPRGRHRIAALIGDQLPTNTAFVARKPIGLYPQGAKHRPFSPQRLPLVDAASRSDWILGRIIRLEGMQIGFNRRGPVDSFCRFIYLHGTSEEHLLGQPVSHGCIRLPLATLLPLFERVHLGERVYIREGVVKLPGNRRGRPFTPRFVPAAAAPLPAAWLQRLSRQN